MAKTTKKITKEERIAGFKKDLEIASEKWKIDIGAKVETKPILGFIDLDKEEELATK